MTRCVDGRTDKGQRSVSEPARRVPWYRAGKPSISCISCPYSTPEARTASPELEGLATSARSRCSGPSQSWSSDHAASYARCSVLLARYPMQPISSPGLAANRIAQGSGAAVSRAATQSVPSGRLGRLASRPPGYWFRPAPDRSRSLDLVAASATMQKPARPATASSGYSDRQDQRTRVGGPGRAIRRHARAKEARVHGRAFRGGCRTKLRAREAVRRDGTLGPDCSRRPCQVSSRLVRSGGGGAW